MTDWKTWIRRVFFHSRTGTAPSPQNESEGSIAGADERLIRLQIPALVSSTVVVFHRAEPGSAILTDPAGVVCAELDRPPPDEARMLATLGIRKGLCRVIGMDRSKAPPLPPQLLEHGQLSQEDREHVELTTHNIALMARDANASPRIGLRAAMKGAQLLALKTNGFIVDAAAARFVAPASIRENAPSDPDRVEDHVAYFSSEREGAGTWTTTKGMAKFGLPELEIVTDSNIAPAAVRRLFESLGSWLVGQVDQLTKADRLLVLSSQVTLPLEGQSDGLRVGLEHRPGKDGGDSFLRIKPPRGRVSGEWIKAIEKQLLGIRSVAKRNPAMEAAHQQAVAELPALREKFASLRAQGTTVMVKHGVATTDGNKEYLWFQVEAWNEARLSCLVANQPSSECELKYGQPIELTEGDVFDWVTIERDGTTRGGATSHAASGA